MLEYVLFVDDDPSALRAYQRAMRNESFGILTAPSGRDALQLLKGVSVPVVVTDERMPLMSGTQLLSQIKQQRPEVIGIVLTGSPSLNSALYAINASEVFRYLQKPCDEELLRTTLREAFKKKHELIRETSPQENDAQVKASLEKRYPGITKVQRDKDGIAVINES